MYLVLVILAAIGIAMAALAAITALVRSIAERRAALHKPASLHMKH
jgi:hypothetical protein